MKKPASTKKDKRVSFVGHRLEHEGHVWFINAKADPATQVLKVYRVEGDMTKPAVLNEALQSLADSVGLKFALETP